MGCLRSSQTLHSVKLLPGMRQIGKPHSWRKTSAKHAYAPETWETWEKTGGWEQNSTFRSSLSTPGVCQEWLGIVWRVALSCQELRVPGRVGSNWPLKEQSQASWSDWEWHRVGRVKLWINLTSLYTVINWPMNQSYTGGQLAFFVASNHHNYVA